MMKDNRIRQIISVTIILIAILLLFLWLLGTIPEKGTEKSPENNTLGSIDLNSSPSQLPSDIKNEIRQYSRGSFAINKWEIDRIKKNEIILYVYDIQNMSLYKDLQGKQIGTYTLKMINDTDFETTRSEVRAYLQELKKNPDYKISIISMVTDRISDTPGNYAELWVDELTPENKKLDNTIIKGWKVVVYPVSSPPPMIQTPKMNNT